MSIKENVAIPVYNYNESNICIPTNISTHILPPAVDGVPSVAYLSFAEINYINGISDCFRTGLVQFDDKDKEEIYTTLGFASWKDILTNKEIIDILLHPTLEGLQKIVNITNKSVFDRVRTIYVSLKESPDNDMSNRVIKIMDTRESEFKRGIYKSQIVLKSKDVPETPVSKEELEAVKAQNNELMSQLAEMKAMLEALKDLKKESATDTKTTDVPKRTGKTSIKK